jgi:hypothetical protein
MFFHFRQANVGGKFYWTRYMRPNILIEADAPEDANERALLAGIYFKGATTGIDCNCNVCGDRWEQKDFDEEGTIVPTVYEMPILVSPEPWENMADTVVHYKKGKTVYAFAQDIYKKGIAVPHAFALELKDKYGCTILGKVTGAGWRLGVSLEWGLVTFPTELVRAVEEAELQHALERHHKYERRTFDVIAGVPI